MNRTLRTILLAPAMLASFLAAQNPQLAASAAVGKHPGRDLAPIVTPIHSSPSDPDGDYGTWAAGHDYKVSFHGDMTFVPYLGQDYPRNQPWSWRTIAASSGGVPLPIDDAGRSHDELRFQYRRGAVVESYEVRAAGLEQTFVIARRPATPGAIVVTGAIASDLQAEPFANRHTAVSFFDAAGTPILTYGESIAFDRRGRQVDVLTSFDGERLSLTVPAGFVAEAEFPLTIDPLISANNASANGGKLTSIDIVRDDRFDRVAVCHARWASVGDADCWATEWADSLMLGTSAVLFTDLNSSWSTDEIACAAADAPQRYCFAIRRHLADDSSRIRYHVRETGDMTLAASVSVISGPSGSIDWRVDVGGTSMSVNGDGFVIVWQRDLATSNTSASRIHGAFVDTATETATLLELPPTVFAVGADCEFPSINQVERVVGTTPFAWAVAWQESAAGGLWAAAIRKVDHNGVVSPSFLRLANGLQHLQPQVGGSSGRYAIAYGTASSSQLSGATTRTFGYGIDVRRFDWPVGGPQSVRPAEALKSRVGATVRQWRTTGIAFDHETESHWLVMYLSDSLGSGTGNGNGYAARVGYRGAVVEEDILLHDNTDPGWRGATHGKAFYDDDADEFVAAAAIRWTPAHGARSYRIGHAPVVPASQDGFGCSPAGISWVGFGNRQQIGCQFSRVRVTNAPAGVPHLLLASFDKQDVILFHPVIESGCRLHLDTVTSAYLGAMPLAVGSTVEWQFPLPEFLDPGTLYFQDWHFDASGNLLQSTSRLEVPIAK